MLKKALWCMLVLSALYEPLRQVAKVLGVGITVGGEAGGTLVNMESPSMCHKPDTLGGHYCFDSGVIFGFTVFGLIVMVLWSAPVVLTACATTLRKDRALFFSRERLPRGARSPPFNACLSFEELWLGISCIWFFLPLAYFLSNSFYQKDVWHFTLALGLSSAFPLCWHLSLVAMPMSDVVLALTELDPPRVERAHRAVGWATLRWTLLHSACELVYLTSQGIGQYFRLSGGGGSKGDNLRYVVGVVALGLLVAHSAVAALRRSLGGCYRKVHGSLAALLLLLLAAHWWPLALFLIPAAASHGAGLAHRMLSVKRPGLRAAGRRLISAQLAIAVLAALAAFCGVWQLRAFIMSRFRASTWLPFIFPPTAILCGFLASLAAGAAVLGLASSRAYAQSDSAAALQEALG